jgi:hypothetical protein
MSMQDAAKESDAVARYVALDADSEADAYADGDIPTDTGDSDRLQVFARCDAALALAPRLADSPDLAWAFAEARRLACSGPRVAAGTLPWYRRARVAWTAAGVSTAAAVALAVVILSPAG